MKKIILFILLLLPSLFFGQVVVGNAIIGSTGVQCGKALALSGDGTTVAIGCPESDTNGTNSGEIRIYERSGNTWVYLTTLPGATSGNKFGSSVSISYDGSRIAVGAPYSAPAESGGVKVYQNNSGSWNVMGAAIYGDAQSNLGISVSLSSDGATLAVGASGGANNGFDSGFVRMYQFSGSAWVQVGSDINGDMGNDYLGRSVSLSSNGNIVAIGANGNDANGNGSGQVKVFQNIANTWTQIGGSINGEAANDGSGFSVSLSGNGNVVAIGALNNDGNGADSGHVRVYQNMSGTWTQMGADIDGEASGDYFGTSVSLSNNGNVLVVGATGNDDGGSGDDFGQARAYQFIGGSWTQVTVDIDGATVGSNFGRAVSISSDGSIVFAGAPFYNQNRGYVRGYDISATLSVEKVVGHSQIKVYPNPVKNNLTIRLDNGLEFKQANIYNNIGQLVLSSKTNQIDVSKLSQGAYLLEIQTNRGKESRKIMVH